MRRAKLLLNLIKIGAVLALCWLLLPQLPLLDGVDFSRTVLDRKGNLLRVTLTSDGKYRLFTPLAEISPRVIAATLRHEDQHYESHNGINPVSTLRAAWHYCFGHACGGASTITMQVARLRFHLHTRTLHGKLVQMMRALELERHYTKAQILEAYFNLAPYGRNIEGIGAATTLYLQKPPTDVNWAEAAALCVIPQSPFRRTPQAQHDNPALDHAGLRLYDELLADGRATDPLGRNFHLRASGHPVSLAPHFSEHLLVTHPEEAELATTLDLSLQQLMERQIAAFVKAQAPLGIHNAAALLVDTRTMDVLADCGSANFSDNKIQGQVDGTRSLRSPGSTLKPFIYGLALQQGLIQPQSLLVDAPARFADYSPENSDREFCGPISATEALARSRNVPAVALDAQLARPTLYQFLQQAGVTLPADAQHYGLALTLGGGEVTMEDLVRLYAMLANGGQWKPLRRETREPVVSAGRSLLSPEASFLTLEMLANIPAPNESDPTVLRSVFWKTGTSHACRDAWTVAVCDHYVLAVWVGNFNGRGNPAFAGRSAAAPLAFNILHALHRDGALAWQPHVPAPGLNLRQVELCADSGDLPNDFCPHRRPGWFIPGLSPIRTCAVHQQVLVDAESGLRLSAADGSHTVRREVYEFWPSNLLALFEKAGLPRRVPPPYAPGASVEALSRRGVAPRITSLEASHLYFADSDAASDRGLNLTAETDGDVHKLYWFAGHRYLGACNPRDPFIWHPTAGQWKIIALDDHGRASTCTITVQSLAAPAISAR
ncbi:MAG: penicillin-binding protein 1C [Chthoniobacteraceae bacterium]